MNRCLLILVLLKLSCSEEYRPEGYIGCFMDYEKRVLRGKKSFSDTNNGQECIEYCDNYGYKYAGTQNARECFCGNTLMLKQPVKPTPPLSCVFKCPGNKNEICGGYWKMSVYETNPKKHTSTTKKIETSPSTTTKTSTVSEQTSTHTTETTQSSTTRLTTQDHATKTTEEESSTVVTLHKDETSSINKQIQPNRTTDKTSNDLVIMIASGSLVVSGTVIAIVAIVVAKKRKPDGDGDIKHVYSEPLEPGSYEHTSHVNGNNPHSLNNGALRSERTSAHTVVNANSAIESYELLQNNSMTGNEYATIAFRNASRDRETDKRYDVLDRRSQHNVVYSEINPKR